MLATAGSYATAQIVEIDTVRGTLRYVNAGHPYPLVRRANGDSGDADATVDGPCSASTADPAPRAATPFEPGDQLLLYTDGLIERREQSIDQHMDRLAELFAAELPTADRHRSTELRGCGRPHGNPAPAPPPSTMISPQS